jgi:drug/metabolite transporter (DMT)-like permease
MGWWLAALSLAVWVSVDALRKVLGRTISPRDLALALAVVQIPAFTVALFFVGVPPVPRDYWLPSLVTIFFNLVGNVLFLTALQLAPYSRVLPFLAFTPVFTALGAWLFLAQEPTGLALVGMTCVVFGGIWLTQVGEARKNRWSRLLSDRGVLLMILTAFCWSQCAVFDLKAAQTIPSSKLVAVVWHLWFLSVGIAVGYGVVAMFRPPDIGSIMRRFSLLLLVAFGFVCGMAIQMGAFLLIPVAVVETIKRAGSLAASVVLGALAFREPAAMRRLPPVALMAVGVAATVLGQSAF